VNQSRTWSVKGARGSVATAPGVVAFGGSAHLSGRLEAAGAGVAGAALAVSSSPDGATWSELTGVVTDDAGAFALQVTPDPGVGATRYRAAFAGDAALQPAEASLVIGSLADITPPAVPKTVGRDSRFTASGVLRPRHAAGTTVVSVLCYRREAGSWVRRATFGATARDDAEDSSTYRAGVKLPSAGTWRLRARHVDAGHARTLSGWSSSFKVTARLDAPVWDRDGVTTIPERMASRLDARQLVVITGGRLGARTGTLRVYDYDAGDWVRAMSVPVRLGTNGLTNGLTRRAGTRTTPTGIWRMATFAFGTHAQAPTGCELRWRQITRRSWWSSEHNATYNTWVETSRHVYGEHLADYPGPYEFAISSGYNALPNTRVYGRGSGIFVHVIHPGYSQGCIMLARSEMIRLLRTLDPDARPACAIGTTRTGTATSIYAY
jgi:L,D-peptidoglycan transpeptidase YkuD (ErfK/YbiS/YcfS/YnhG family)